MNSLQNILVLDCGSENVQTALNRAVNIATSHQAEIHVLHCRKDGGPNKPFVAPERQQLEMLHNIIAEQVPDKVTVTTHTVRKREVSDAIMACCEMLEPEIVIKSIQQEGFEEHFFSQSLDNHLIRNSPTPTLFVRKNSWQTGAQVLAAIDAEENNPEVENLNGDILEFTELMAEQFESAPSLLSTHLTPLVDPAVGNSGVVFERYKQKIVERHHANIQALVQARKFRLKNRHVLEGTPEDRITELAGSQNFQLVVMGSHRRSGIKAAMLGNIAENLIATNKLEVLTLPA